MVPVVALGLGGLGGPLGLGNGSCESSAIRRGWRSSLSAGGVGGGDG